MPLIDAGTRFGVAVAFVSSGLGIDCSESNHSQVLLASLNHTLHRLLGFNRFDLETRDETFVLNGELYVPVSWRSSLIHSTFLNAHSDYAEK